MRFFITTILSAFLFVSLIACGVSSKNSSSPAENPQSSNKPTNNSSNAAKETTNNSTTETKDSSAEQNNSNSPNDSSQSSLDERTGAVFNAVLKYESNQPNTSVDYKSYTMTQNGKKVRLTIEPTSEHHKDFKEGFVKEVVNNNDESHDVTLFQYKIDEHNNLALIDTASEKVVYTTSLTDTGAKTEKKPKGDWVKAFEKELNKGYHVTPSRYKYIGNGNWEVWVKEVNTGENPYVTVNQNTGDFHG